jgi:hypothetical protein
MASIVLVSRNIVLPDLVEAFQLSSFDHSIVVLIADGSLQVEDVKYLCC